MKWLPCLLVVLSACKPVSVTGPSPERAFVLYDVAWRCGQRDSLTPLPYNPQRYQDKLADFNAVSQAAEVFRKGYEDGFSQHPEEPLPEALVAYDRDFRRGRLAAWSKSPSPEVSASKGFTDGFNGKPHAYSRPY